MTGKNKIIFLDVDGSLVDYEGRVPVSAVEAVRGARANGHKVYICTGRSRAEVYPEIRAMADYVTDDVEHDGLWKAFSHLGLL